MQICFGIQQDARVRNPRHIVEPLISNIEVLVCHHKHQQEVMQYVVDGYAGITWRHQRALNHWIVLMTTAWPVQCEATTGRPSQSTANPRYLAPPRYRLTCDQQHRYIFDLPVSDI